MGYGTLSKNTKKTQKTPKTSETIKGAKCPNHPGQYWAVSKNIQKLTRTNKVVALCGAMFFSKKSRQDKTSISAAFVKVEAFLRIRMGTIVDYGVQSETAKTYVFAAVCESYRFVENLRGHPRHYGILWSAISNA